MQGGFHLKRPGCDGTIMVPILLTSIFTFCRASANITSAQHAPPAPKRKTSRSSRHEHPATTFPTHRLLTSSSLPALRSAQVCKMWWGMHAGRKWREGGREGLLLLTGKILLIKKKKKKNLLSKCFGGFLAVWHGRRLDGWVDRLWGRESVLASGEKVSESSKSDWQYLQRSRGHGDDMGRSRRHHNGLFTSNALTEHFTESVGCVTEGAALLSQCECEFGQRPRETLW